MFEGEALNLTKLKGWFNYYGYNQPTLVNMYGITETTVHVTYKPIEEKDIGLKSLIGSRIPDLKTYVLDAFLNPLPIGAVGELFVGGEGLARGYLNQPELTAAKFISNPFQSEEEKKSGKNSRLYKTGDLVRWLPDGNLEFLGRNDFQVKIRGFRIELGEIEAALNSYEGIQTSVVLAKEHTGGSKYLVGYYVSESRLDEQKLMSDLKDKLPEYMVPSVFVHLDQLPLTVNGKLDRKVLPEPEFTHSATYIAPRTELEKQVCQIWAETLGLPVRAGGNSGRFL